MLRTLLKSLVVVALLAKVASSYYTIVGPSYIQSDSIYSVAVLSDAADLTSVELTIENDQNFTTSQTVIIQPFTSKIVNFAIRSLDETAAYTFTAVGQNGFDFNNETTLTLQTKKTSVFIQTDKAMYKPGDNVQFRVIVVDKNLNPAPIEELDIYITDANQNRVDQWLNVVTSAGVYNGQLQLSSTPCLGEWTINVNVNEETAEKTFEIAQYVLPKFEVDVTAPIDATYTADTLIINVKAVYTYGENVDGVAVVSISGPVYSWQPTPSSPIAQKTVDINGNANVVFQTQDLKYAQQDYSDDYEITASVTEALTGVVLQGTTTVTVRPNKFTVTNLNNDYNSYTPGPYTLSLQFSYYDGSPYIDTVGNITVSYGANYDQSNSTFLANGNMDLNGVATININLPDLDNGFYVFIQFQDYSDEVGWYSKAQPFTDIDSLSVRLLTLNPKSGDDVSIEITSADVVPYFTYLITSRGNLISSATKFTGNQTTVTITIKASFSMVPTAQFVAYYISSSGDIITGSTQISVTGLNNFVTLTTSADEKQPGENVDINILSKPLSNICLLGIDQSVALLATGNDIEQSDVYSELDLYTTVTSGGGGGGFIGGPIIRPLPIFEPGPVILNDAVAVDAVEADGAKSRKKRLALLPSYGGNNWQDFNSAGLFILTNCNEPQIFWRRFPIALANAAGPAVSVVTSAPPQQSASSTTTIRKYFPETWIWNCYLSGSGSLTLNETAPDTITSWYLTGFATNDKFGLGVTEDKTIFKVFKKFFISLNLPYSIKRGEAVLLQIVIFNYLSVNVTTKVTLDNSLEQFEFIDPHTQALKDKGCPPSIDKSRTKTVSVNSNDGVSLSFLITALVNATSNLAGDAIEVPLLVVPEGVTQFKNQAQFVDLRNTTKYTTQLTVDVPTNAVTNSTIVQISAIGDVMGVALQNIDLLIQLPCGCGEQTMIGLSPDVVIYDYLKKVGLLTPALQTKLENYMKQGYQGELSYKHSDNSFSAFGNSDNSGSTWLTAFVIRIFIQASPYITIDPTVIEQGLTWLNAQQQPNGSFNEPGNVIHTDMQGLAAKGVALTAYVVVTFLLDKV